jgi:hypothetical protein
MMSLGDSIGPGDDLFYDVEMIPAGHAPLPTQFFRLDGDFFGASAPGDLLQAVLTRHAHDRGDPFDFLMSLAELITQGRWNSLDVKADLPCFFDFVTSVLTTS